MDSLKICVYAICKNESKFVEKWLDSMQEADYICVLDTGSTDDTVKKLKADPRVTIVKKQKIEPWRFDVARNESMKLVPEDADVLVCTDFDEVFEPGWASTIRQYWKPGTSRMLYTFAWSHNEKGEPQDIFKYDKIHTRDYHWVFPVHEVLEQNDPSFEACNIDVGQLIFLHHYPDKTKERAYYMDLLKTSCEENPDDCHVHMLYAREFLIQKKWEDGLREFLKVLKMPDIDKPNRRLVLLNSLMQTALIYEELENYDECLWYCQEFIKEDRTYRDPYLLMGEVYNKMTMYSLAEACVNAGLEYGRQHYDWVERTTTWLGWAYDVRSIAEYYLGKIDKAIEDAEVALDHEPNDPRILRNYNLYLKTKIQRSELYKENAIQQTKL